MAGTRKILGLGAGRVYASNDFTAQKGLTRGQVEANRADAVEWLEAARHTVVDSFVADEPPADSNAALYWQGEIASDYGEMCEAVLFLAEGGCARLPHGACGVRGAHKKSPSTRGEDERIYEGKRRIVCIFYYYSCNSDSFYCWETITS